MIIKSQVQVQQYLKNLIRIIDVEIKIVDKEIIVENEKIEFTKQQLIRISNDIVKIEEEIRKLEGILHKMKQEQERERSVIMDLEKEINESKYQLSSIYEQMERQRKVIRDAYPFGFLVKGIMDLVNKLSGEFDRIKSFTEQLEWRLRKLSNMYEESIRRYRDIDESIENTHGSKKKLIVYREGCEKELSLMGKSKTNSENLKIDLNKFRVQCAGVLDKIQMNLEFDEMFYSTDEINKLIQEVYSKYNRKMPQSMSSISTTEEVIAPLFILSKF